MRQESLSEEDAVVAGISDNRASIEDDEELAPPVIAMSDADGVPAPAAATAAAAPTAVTLHFEKLSNCYLGNHSDYATPLHDGQKK